ncbi:MAG: ACT domain-containing protein [Candidatus Gastranaerophilales bacterium]|nr:ACT domain-containing protein [Candidatus Gastranaerophilales bacterium]
MEENNQIIITVAGKDKTGIVANVSNALSNHKVNIEDIKQTIMQDNFVMIMLCNIEKMEVSFKEFKDNLQTLGEELGMEIWVQKKDIFDKMHTI